MTLFYLVRHGQVDRRADAFDPPLSLQGRAEAEQVAAFLHGQPVVHIYTSPLQRAREMANHIAAVLGAPVSMAPRLRERMNFGDLPGQSFEQFVALWERCSQARDELPPVGDSSRGAGQRVESFIADAHAAHPGTEVVAVMHGGIIADFLLNVCAPAQLAQLSPAFAAQPYSGEVMKNGAITVVEYDGEGAARFVVKAIALTEHLTPL